MNRYVSSLEEIDRAQIAIAGGKGASLGELTRIEGIHVPPGFCVTTDAFDRILAASSSIGDALERLARVEPDDREATRVLNAEVRAAIEAAPVPAEVEAAIADALGRLGDATACAVRSSATAEDLPTASFAGQQDSYLNVVGRAAILEHLRRCWASLFTDRAVAYRTRNGFDHRRVHMAVVVQRMIAADAAGVLFTADPMTSNRTIASVEAAFGLGEGFVSGRVDPDRYRVRDGVILTRDLAGAHAALTDTQVVELVQLGRRIEAHFGRPQDVEWCLADGGFHFVQSRPITTLFPVPVEADGAKHVYVSVGHQQMMTDAMKPLGLSLWQLTTARPMVVAGGRLFVDVTQQLASPASRAALLGVFGRGDPLLRDALQTLLDRGDVIPSLPGPAPVAAPAGGAPAPIATDPAIPAELVARNRASVAALKRDIRAKSGAALLDFILEDLQELRRLLFDPRSTQAIMAGMEATWWLNDQLEAWLGEKNAADAVTRSLPDNVTSQMGLALLDVADVVRPHPAVVELLRSAGHDDGFLDRLPAVEGGSQAHDAIQAYLDAYGMRCVGEIDVTRPRWSEQPSALVPMILANVRKFEPGAGERRFEQGRQAASTKEKDVLERLRSLPDGEHRASETRRMIDRVRIFSGYREYPKYGMISRYAVYKQALLEEAGRLVDAGVLREADDVFYLTFAELHDVVRTGEGKAGLVRARRDEFRSYEALTPPRVLTSDGECLAGAYRRTDLPPGALVGLPVSGGTVTGRARVVHDVAEAQLEAGDILVTPFTDPSWTPVFVGIAGLVTEVGGLMTHGAVIAREYGLPAVVGVEHATRRIRDGQRIRVHGTDGYVELLS